MPGIRTFKLQCHRKTAIPYPIPMPYQCQKLSVLVELNLSRHSYLYNNQTKQYDKAYHAQNEFPENNSTKIWWNSVSSWISVRGLSVSTSHFRTADTNSPQDQTSKTLRWISSRSVTGITRIVTNVIIIIYVHKTGNDNTHCKMFLI